MSVAWVAGSVRARLLLGRRVGRRRALELAGSRSLREAADLLAATEYGRHAEPARELEDVQRAVAATTLFHLRILAGWLPPGALELMRALAAWFELANVEDRLAYLAGREPRRPFELGSLALAWSTVARAQSAADLRAALASSSCGDPGSEEPADVGLALRAAWGRRLHAEVPEARAWAAGALALLLARELLLVGRDPEVLRKLDLASPQGSAPTVAALADTLPREAAWALAGIGEPDDLWRGEPRWWAKVERDAEAMVSAHREGRALVVGAVALLAADARRVSAALAAASLGAAAELEEMLDGSA